MAGEDKLKALDAAIAKLEKDYGKGAVMKLGALILRSALEECQRDVLSRFTDQSQVVRQQ